jgi:hypothetical protein
MNCLSYFILSDYRQLENLGILVRRVEGSEELTEILSHATTFIFFR